MRREFRESGLGLQFSGCKSYEFVVVVEEFYREEFGGTETMFLGARITAEGILYFDGPAPQIDSQIELDQYVPQCLGLATIVETTCWPDRSHCYFRSHDFWKEMNDGASKVTFDPSRLKDGLLFVRG